MPRRTVSQRSSSASYHAALPCLLFLSLSLSLFPPRHISCVAASRAPYIYLRPRAPRYGPRIAEQKQCTLSSDRPRCNAVTPSIASREAARKWQFALDRAPWYGRSQVPHRVRGCSRDNNDLLEGERLASRERAISRVVELVERNARCVCPSGCASDRK